MKRVSEIMRGMATDPTTPPVLREILAEQHDTLNNLEAWFDHGEAMRLVLPLAPNRANARHHWRVALKAKKAHWAECTLRYQTGQLPGYPRHGPPQRARISATLYVWSPMDDDNAMARLKHTIDWLVAWGYLAGDSRKHLEWAGIPDQHIDRKNQRVELEIEAA